MVNYSLYRRHVWEDNLAMISKHNYEAMMGKQSYWMGVNQFTDMVSRERKIEREGDWESLGGERERERERERW